MSSAASNWMPKFFSACLPQLRVFVENWIIWAGLIAATCLMRWCYKGLVQNCSRQNIRHAPSDSHPRDLHQASQILGPSKVSARNTHNQRPKLPLAFDGTQSVSRAMRYPLQVRATKKAIIPVVDPPPPLKTKQPYEVFLVLDVEATCYQGTDFNFPNEIIEFPVCIMRWKDRSEDHTASQLEVVAEFRSFVKPTWRPILSEFCTNLTGITQEQVDSAPPFPEVIKSFQTFLIKHGLLDAETGERLVRFCWCSDGPFDVRDFVVKQCFISKVQMPGWIQGDVLDVRAAVMDCLQAQTGLAKHPLVKQVWNGPRRPTLNISAQLKALGLPAFEGRQHSGIDDSRNIARIIAELAQRGVCLFPNTFVHPNRRWHWMGKHGQVLEDHLLI